MHKVLVLLGYRGRQLGTRMVRPFAAPHDGGVLHLCGAPLSVHPFLHMKNGVSGTCRFHILRYAFLSSPE